MSFHKKQYKDVITCFSEKNILVIGDLMLDIYYWGKTERISPEAPVPIVEVSKTNFNPGGAGNVALNLAGLGSGVSLLAVVGNDNNGSKLVSQLLEANIDVSPVITLDNYQTSAKTRVIAQDQQVVRIDQEEGRINSKLIIPRIDEYLEKNVSQFDGIVIADYNKGLLSKTIINNILKIAKDSSVPIYVDPKWNNFYEYKNVRFFKPNAQEFQKAIGSENQNIDYIKNGTKLLEKLNADILLITRGSDDAVIFGKDGYKNIPTESQSVHDVSGAGDTVIAVFTLADLCGANPLEAAQIANFAAGVVCSRVGVVPISVADLR